MSYWPVISQHVSGLTEANIIFLVFCVLDTQWCLNLWPHGLCSPLGSSVHGIFQARILKWVANPFSRDNGTQVSCIAGRFFTDWATREAHDSSRSPGKGSVERRADGSGNGFSHTPGLAEISGLIPHQQICKGSLRLWTGSCRCQKDVSPNQQNRDSLRIMCLTYP